MRLLLIGLATLLITGFLAQWVVREPGYVLIAYGRTSVELSLVLFVALSVLAFALLYIGLRALVHTWQLPRDLGRLRAARRRERARRGLARGLIELAEGRWAQAERLLVQSAKRSQTPLLNYLAAARAAQMQRAYSRRDEYLRRAIESDPRADVAVGLTQAELQLAHQQFEHSLATLNRLKQLAPRHSYADRLLARLYRRLEDWEPLFALLPTLRRSEVLETAELEELEEAAAGGLLARADSAQRIEEIWKALPRRSRTRPSLVAAHAQALVRLEHPARAEMVLRQALNHAWDESLAEAYGRVPHSDPGRALAQAEAWLKEHGRSPALLLTLGRLCRQARIWGKARAYLESSLDQQPRPETYRELGELLEEMGQTEAAQECFRKGLRLAVEGIAEPLSRPSAKALASRPRQAVDYDPDDFSA